jgi:hypothetical protein
MSTQPVPVRAETALSLGNESPAISVAPGAGPTTINISFVHKDASSATEENLRFTAEIAANREAVTKLLPTLEKVIDARLGRVLSNQEKQGRKLADIKGILQNEVVLQLRDIAAQLGSITPEALAAALRDQLMATSMKLSAELAVTPSARCAGKAACVRLSYAGEAQAVSLRVRGVMGAGIASGAPMLDRLLIRCADSPYPYEPVSVDLTTPSEFEHAGVRDLMVQKTSEGGRLRATIAFTPTSICSDSQIVVSATGPNGATAEANARFNVVAGTVWVSGTGSDLSIRTEARWDVEERRIVPLWSVSGDPLEFEQFKGQLSLLDGPTLVQAGRELRHKLEAMPAPAPAEPARYRELLGREWWDMWGYGDSVCWRIAHAIGGDDGMSSAAQRWEDDCLALETKQRAELAAHQRRPSRVALSFSKRYPSYVLEFRGATTESSGWTAGRLEDLRQHTPGGQREEVDYVRDGAAPSDTATLHVDIYGQPDLWFTTGLGAHYGYAGTFLLTWELTFPLLWDVLEVGGGFGTDGGDSALGFATGRVSLVDLVTILARGASSRSLQVQIGTGYETAHLANYTKKYRISRQFADLFVAYVLPGGKGSKFVGRLGASWRPGGSGGTALFEFGGGF